MHFPSSHVVFAFQAWALEQGEGSRRAFATQDVLVPWCLARKFAAGSDEEVTAAGGVIDSARNVVVFQRFCHVYRRGELEELLKEAAEGMGLVVVGSPGGAEVVSDGSALRNPINQVFSGELADPMHAIAGAVPVLRMVASWWDKDNWCVIAARDVMPL